MKNFLKKIPWAAAGSMLLFAALIVWFIAALSGAGTASEQQTLSAIKQSVENGITMCYSIEGAYPESIDQLTESPLVANGLAEGIDLFWQEMI